MHKAIDPVTCDIDIACSLPATELAERGKEFESLLADADEVVQLQDGYGLRFPNRDAWISRAVELIVAERKCCPFFGFSLIFEAGGGPVWLHVQGPADVKTFISEQMVPAHLRSAVGAAGLNAP